MENNDFVLDVNNDEFLVNTKKDTVLKVSYQSKEVFVCPVCKEEFHKEELFTGSGRLIAGSLTDELHRLYEPSAKYGELYPLAYHAVVCPGCWFASNLDDFNALPENARHKIQVDEEARKKEVGSIFPPVDFYESRSLVSGAVSQYLIMRCYDYYPADFSPTVKAGIAALRAGWLLEHINEKEPGQHWDWLAQLFKKKAHFFCRRALDGETGGGGETLSGLKSFGPDLDKNYGYEGFLYITGLLEFKCGSRKDPQKRKDLITESRQTLAKMFGLGKSSKSKPGPLLEKSRSLYADISKELQDFDE
ncbi:MAG: DUF2225 domain-containing protein [Spirochaetaceae bacterium]|jgi:uncharacterized protein (DUF2225 family)|nr:DUF2225 domain-containing protein [Spirochaetaceae bacterium]